MCDADGALCSTVPIVAASCFVTAQKGKLRERERRDKTATAEQMVINSAFSRLKFCYLGGNPTLDYTSESQGTKCSLVAEVYPYMERVVRKYIFHNTYRDLVKRSQQKGIIHYQNKSNAHNPVMIQPPFVNT